MTDDARADEPWLPATWHQELLFNLTHGTRPGWIESEPTDEETHE